MIWRNPWAFWGLAAVVVPVLIHLLGRERARVQRFPTLRFLELSRVLPTRRRRLKDVLLLAVRVAIVAAAVGALARPFLLTADRKADVGASLTRAIIVDTSPSMRRPSSTGGAGLEVARREAQRVTGEAARSETIETSSPAAAVPGASAWLETQPGQREIVIVSDFQRGALNQADVARIPLSVGLRLVRVEVRADSGPVETRVTNDGVETVAHLTPHADRTDVEWTVRPANTARHAALTLVTAPGEEGRAEAARRAALAVGAPVLIDTARRVAIVYSRPQTITDRLSRATPVANAWMADVAARLRDDRMLAGIVASVPPSAEEFRLPDRFVGVARSPNGRLVVFAAQETSDGRDRLVLFCFADPGSLTSAALITAVHRAMSTDASLAELEPLAISDENLRVWERAPAPPAVSRATMTGEESDGRWIWVLVAILLAVETWVRRTSHASTNRAAVPRVDERGRERVA